MKKFVVSLLLIVFILTLLGCRTQNTKIEDEGDYGESIIQTLDLVGKIDSDYFIGKVLSVKKIDELDCVNYMNDSKDGYLFNIEVVDTLWATTVEKGTEIQAGYYGSWMPPLEKNKTYLISGIAQISNCGLVLLVNSRHTHLLNDDGSMERVVDYSQYPHYAGIIEHFNTLDEFKNAEPVKRLMETEPNNLPPCFYMDWIEETPIRVTDGGKVLIEKGEKQHSREEVLGYVREAVKKDSKVKIEHLEDIR